MPFFLQKAKEVCVDGICGVGLGLVQGCFGLSLFTPSESEEIHSLKTLALSMVQKSPEIVTDPTICNGIQEGKKAALDTFIKTTPAEVGVVAAAELVCKKAFEQRFREVLMGACLNLVGC